MRKVTEINMLLDIANNSPVVLLKLDGGESILPIWIGKAEALAISITLSGIKPPRPMTHDLLSSILTGLGVNLQKIVITALQRSTYFALIYIQNNSELLVIDARPSDSIALALRAKSDIFVEDDVPTLNPNGESAKEYKALLKRLKKINPENFNQF
ncbi:bifunctional nuclease family protein [bacterium]|nr:bifunctional nuclease family protein [bacterium]